MNKESVNMQINLVSCIFVLDSEKNDNIRKNDVKRLKVLVSENGELPAIEVKNTELKKQVKKYISCLTGTGEFHLEQVYTMDYKNDIDIIYLAVTNVENIKKLKREYKLVDFLIKDNRLVLFDNKEYEYKTIEIETNNNMEYIHEINVKDKRINRTLMNLLISYKRIRNDFDTTDLIFKFMGASFTLEDVRIVYELIKDCTVDKSNFRKRIIKYSEIIDGIIETKNGFRPSQIFVFKPLKGDAWL